MRDMTPRPPEWIDSAPIKTRASREIIATPEEVWAVLIEHTRWPEWFDALARAEGTGGDGLGSTRSVWIKNWRIDEEFVIWDEPNSFGFTVLAADGPIGRFAETLNERVDVQVLSPDRVRVTYLQGWQPRSGFAARVLKSTAKRTTQQLRGALASLEDHIERERSTA